MKTIQAMGTADLFSLYERLLLQLNTRFGSITQQRGMVLQTVLRINEELQDRVPGDKSLTDVRQKLRDQIAITNQLMRGLNSRTRKSAPRIKRRRKK